MLMRADAIDRRSKEHLVHGRADGTKRLGPPASSSAGPALLPVLNRTSFSVMRIGGGRTASRVGSASNLKCGSPAGEVMLVSCGKVAVARLRMRRCLHFDS